MESRLRFKFCLLLFLVSISSHATAKNSDEIFEIVAEKHDISHPLGNTLSNQIHSNYSWQNNVVTQNTSIIPFRSFAGLGVDFPNYTINFPTPEISGAVGLTQYVQWVNADIGIFDKATGYMLAGFPKPGNYLWKGFGGLCETNNDRSFTVKYDQTVDRWIFTQIAWGDVFAGPFYQCIAISTTPDATGTYYRYAFPFESFNATSELGLWSNAYLMTFDINGPFVYGPRVCALNKNNMLQGSTASMQCRQFPSETHLLPADLDGKTLPPANTPGFFISSHPQYNLNVYSFYVDFANSKNSHLDGQGISLIKPMPNGGAYQPNGVWLNINGGNVLRRFAYRQFQNYGSFVIGENDADPYGYNRGPFWYEFRLPVGGGGLQMYQASYYMPDGKMRFNPSLAMDKVGNIAMAYNISTSVIYPSIEMTNHLNTDPLNQMNTPQPLTTGTGSNTDGQWSNHNSMSVDPVDDCTFWFSGEYMKETGSNVWSTRIISFQLPNCQS